MTGSYHGIFDEVIVRGTRKLRTIPADTGIELTITDGAVPCTHVLQARGGHVVYAERSAPAEASRVWSELLSRFPAPTSALFSTIGAASASIQPNRRPTIASGWSASSPGGRST